MKETLIIIGASGHGKVIADIASRMNKWLNIYFLDDDASINECTGLKVIGRLIDASKYKAEADFFVAIGNNYTREKIQENLIAEGVSLATIVHPNTAIGNRVEIGMGTVVMAGVVINSSSNIGKGCIINTHSSVDHDNVIEDYVHISPGVNLAGTVRVGKGSWIGIGGVVNNNITICNNCQLGAGTVVIKNIIESGLYVGVPAKKIK